MSQNKQSLELFLYKQGLQSKTLVELIPSLTNKTIIYLLKDLGFEKTNIKEEKNDIIYIFTDGGCKNNGKKNAIAAYSVFFNDESESEYFQFNTSGLVIKEPSNQRAELTAILKSFQIIYENKELFEKKNIIIVSDSIYSINCITKWCKNWKLNGWKTSKNEIIKNQDVIQEMVQLYEKLQLICDIKFKHVFSHTVEPSEKDTLNYLLWLGNKRADENVSQVLERN
jgi:ribonuclease HI